MIILIVIILILLLFLILRKIRKETFITTKVITNNLHHTIGNPSNYISIKTIPFTTLSNISNKGNNITYDEWEQLLEDARKDPQCKGIIIDNLTNQFMKSYKNIEISSTLNTTENNHNRVWLLYDTNIINSSIINNSNISVGKLPNSNTNLSANSININNDDTNSNVVCVTDNQGKECLNTADIYHLSKMPLVFDTNDNICLYDSNKIPVCIGKEELQMLSGKRNFKLKIINTNNPYQNTFLNQKTDNISTGGVLQVSYYNNNEQISVGRNLTGYGLGTTEDEGQDFSFYINTPSDGVPVESIKCADCKP